MPELSLSGHVGNGILQSLFTYFSISNNDVMMRAMQVVFDVTYSCDSQPITGLSGLVLYRKALDH